MFLNHSTSRVSLGYEKKNTKLKQRHLISNSYNNEHQSKRCIFSLSSVIRAQGTMCGQLVNLQVHSCQLERKAVVTLPTAEKDYYSKGWVAKENLLDVSEYQKASQPDFLVQNCRHVLLFCVQFCCKCHFLRNKRIKQKHQYGVAPYPNAHLQHTLITNSLHQHSVQEGKESYVYCRRENSPKVLMNYHACSTVVRCLKLFC